MATSPSSGSAWQRLVHSVKDELRPRDLLISLNVALIIYLVEVITAISFAALIFSGALASYLGFAVTYVLLGAAILIATASILNSYGGIYAGTQDAPVVILATAAASIAAGASAIGDGDSLFATVLLLIVFTTLAMGIVCVLLGAFKLGSLVRFLPYPVIGGFLAGTGWLLAIGGIGIATSATSWSGLLHPEELLRWAPAVVIGLIMFAVTRRWSNPVVLVAAFAGALAVFGLASWALGASARALMADGWLLGPFPGDLAWRLPLDPSVLARVDWPALARALPLAAPAVLIGIVGLFLNSSSLELVTRIDGNSNRDLKATGVANVLASLVGGVIGFSSVSFSSLGQAMSGVRRLPGLISAALLVVTVIVGPGALALMPRMVVGGLLIYIGLDLLSEWVVAARSKLPRIDYAIVISILVVIAATNFLWGVGLGLILTTILFLINYSRVMPIRYQASGASMRSRVNRPYEHAERLQALGGQLLIFKLQGFIFFGTADAVLQQVRARAKASILDGLIPQFIALDFADVTGLDSTGLLSFSRLHQFARDSGIELVFSGATGRTRSQLSAGGFTEGTPGLRLFSDMDRALEWCEDQQLAAEAAVLQPKDLQAQLTAILPRPEAISALIAQLHRRELDAGEYLIQQDAEPDEMFFLESGQLTAQLERPGQAALRLETMRGGCVVGELGFFLGTRRNASVVADRPSVVYGLTRADRERFGTAAPDAAQALDAIALRLLGQRVQHLTRAVNALQPPDQTVRR